MEENKKKIVKNTNNGVNNQPTNKKEKLGDAAKAYEHYKKLKTDFELASTYRKKNNKKTVAPEEKEIDNGLHIGIVGIGGVGTPIAVLLASKGYDVEVTKKNTDDLMIDNLVNLEINGEFGNKSYLVPCVQNNKFTSKKDIIIMCTQSYSTAGALTDVKKYLKPSGIVISMQNVLNFNEIVKVIPRERYIPLIIDWTATRIANNQVIVLRKGDMHIGVLDEKAKTYLPLVKKIFDDIQPTIIQKDMLSFIASRFVLSSTLSCVLALTGHNLKKTATNKVAKKLIVGTINEMIDVFEAYKVDIPPYCDILDYYQFTEKSLKGWWYRKIMFHRFIRKNGTMSSSILRALENKKRTELDSMCNRIVEMAKVKEMQVPFNETISNFLYDVEEGQETIFMENLTKPCFTNLKINWRSL